MRTSPRSRSTPPSCSPGPHGMTRIRVATCEMPPIGRLWGGPGGLTTKIHLVADGRCRRIVSSSRPASGTTRCLRAGDGRRAHPASPCRPAPAPDRVLADKAYPNKAIQRAPEPPRDPDHHSRASRPAGAPRPARTPGRTASRLRPTALPAARCCRELHSSKSSVRSPALRQARVRLPGHRRRWIDQNLAPSPGA